MYSSLSLFRLKVVGRKKREINVVVRVLLLKFKLSASLSNYRGFLGSRLKLNNVGSKKICGDN